MTHGVGIVVVGEVTAAVVVETVVTGGAVVVDGDTYGVVVVGSGVVVLGDTYGVVVVGNGVVVPHWGLFDVHTANVLEES